MIKVIFSFFVLKLSLNPDLKRFLSILLLTCLSFQLLHKVGIIAWFSMNQETVVEFFCINKEKPEMECDGKCYLNKKLSEAAEESPETPVQQNKKDIQEILFFESSAFLTNQDVQGYLVYKITYFNLTPSHSGSIFHPPQA